ncbi:MAG: bifunctional orotidine-5'-phosphate decarboxylase/orotate phosphoribosyltransferase, partial [Okeania sp. SIO2H7]|nr:bifunctional orotidine-5'-phosphate decarboxylase/orotate phosphoribosyltransferase [Okeania sp. SIO2H7]
MNFFDKLTAAIDRNQSLLYLELDPDPESLPEKALSSSKLPAETDNQTLIKNWLESFKYVIDKTVDFVCAYKLTLGYYQSLSSHGIELLQKTIKTIPSNIPIILDAKHGDLNASTVFARTIFEQWEVDAVTVTPYTGH